MDKRKRGRPRIRNGVKMGVVLEADLIERIQQLEPEGREFSSKLNIILRRTFERAPQLLHPISAVEPVPVPAVAAALPANEIGA